jgi:pantoate--beta-alanine ligase
MVIARTVSQLQEAQKELTGTVGFVPTMGALHTGHLSLIRRAREENEHLVVSIFVNPTQFLEGEDLESYPRKEAADSRLCELSGVDILFMPTVDQIYEEDELCIGAPARRGYILEGEMRPGHFDGMLQVVMKLLNLTRASKAYFGKKDAQQLVLVTQMVRSYFLPCEIVPCEIVRDEQGLALSSRNAYLSPEEKVRALSLSRSLKRAGKKVMSGERDALAIIGEMKRVLQEVDHIEYIAVVSRDFKPLERVEIDHTIILVAAQVGSTRLIDNLWI